MPEYETFAPSIVPLKDRAPSEQLKFVVQPLCVMTHPSGPHVPPVFHLPARFSHAGAVAGAAGVGVGGGGFVAWVVVDGGGFAASVAASAAEAGASVIAGVAGAGVAGAGVAAAAAATSGAGAGATPPGAH